MAVPYSNTKLRPPRGFQNLLEGLAREVLRSQPADIPSFAAEYFAALLERREAGGYDPEGFLDPANLGAKREDR